MKQDVAGKSESIDVSMLADGVYIIWAISNNNSATIKFTKE